jgi:hypothetical protein
MQRSDSRTKSSPGVALLFFTFCAIQCLIVGFAAGDEADPSALQLYSAAMEAHAQQDFVSCRTQLERAESMGSNHPALVRRLAGACALTGESDRALDLLERHVAMGCVADLEADDWLAPLRGETRFSTIVRNSAANREPIARSETVRTVPDRELIPEGLAADPATGNLFLGSLRGGRIVRVSAKGEVTPFHTPTVEREWKGLGMKVHAASAQLWVCRNSIEDSTAAGVFAYDLSTGRETRRILIADQSQQHFLNDLVLTDGGDLYATDTDAGCLYRLRHDAADLEVYPLNLEIPYANGITLSTDEQLLFIAHSMGVVRIDLQSGQASNLRTPPAVTVVGIDGLYWYRGDLIAVQNGFSPMRAVRFELNEDATEATAYTVLERNNPWFQNVPTTGAVVGGRFIYIANSQMNLMDDDGSFPDPSLLQDVVLLGAGL